MADVIKGVIEGVYYSQQFEKLKDHDRIAFAACMAIYRNLADESHIIVAAPNVEALAVAWEPIAGRPLDRDLVQHVVVVAAIG